ncbi:MAG TPA: hypothetical protein EYN06_09480 [Myxococcales bacterium]|nr:hypothetical protein [Myxococcales bacterium]
MLRVVPALVVAVCLLVVSPVQAELATVKGAHGFTYSVHFPSNYDVSKQWPMVTLFHWSTGRYGSVYKLWKEIAEENGIILAMPNSRSRMRWTRRDAKKTVSMINAVKSQFNIDPKRVYAVGYSSGANFAYRLMADNPGLFRAVAPFAGRLLASDSKLTHDDAPNTRVCIFHGRYDSIIQFKSGWSAARRLTRTGYEVRTHWLKQGHYFPKKLVPEIWRCVSGTSSHHDS